MIGIDPVEGVKLSMAICDGVNERAHRVAEYLLGTRPDVLEADKEAFLDIASAAAHLALSPGVHIELGSTQVNVSGLLSFRQTLAPGERCEIRPTQGEV